MVGLSANAPLSLVFFGVSSVTAWVVPAYPSIACLIFLKLRALLQAEGDSVPPDDAPVDQSVLIDLCQRLRKYRDLDWSPSPPSRRRSLLRR